MLIRPKTVAKPCPLYLQLKLQYWFGLLKLELPAQISNRKPIKNS